MMLHGSILVHHYTHFIVHEKCFNCYSYYKCIVEDLNEIMLETANVQGQWEEIGQVLKIPHNELKITDNNSSSVTRCHYEMLRYWILKIGGSWKGLADALRNQEVKQEKLADQIMENYG